MSLFNKQKIKRVLLTVMWVAFACGSMVLLIAAVRLRDKQLCKGVEINIHGASNNFFIDRDDIRFVISSYAGNNIKDIEIEDFNLSAMEKELKKEVWIKNAELYFDNNQVLQASVEEREPLARVFVSGGNSFYIDNTMMILPLSDKISARLPTFTGFPVDGRVLSKRDSSLLRDIRNLSIQIQQDSFMMAMIEQVDITPDRTFEMIPKIGEQVIVFGDASDAEQKFNKLRLFYKKVMMKYGWSRYSVINLQYKNQVVGKLKGKDDVSADSLRTVEIMRSIAINAARASSDSVQIFVQDNERNTTSFSLIEQSIERDDEGIDEINPFSKQSEQVEMTRAAVKPVVIKPVSIKPVIKATVKPVAIKPVIKVQKKLPAPAVKQVPKGAAPKPAAIQPKVVMPKKNDY